jgi:siroheme decarboxylase
MSHKKHSGPTPLSDTDRQILRLAQADLPDGPAPFAEMAAQVGVSEDHVLDLLRRMKDSGEIRRFGATLRHQKAGYGANAMVAWRVPEADVERIGALMADRPEISHCYIRVTTPEWTYNLYTMVHAKSPEECRRTVKDLIAYSGISDVDVLLSRKELKKTSMEYF